MRIVKKYYGLAALILALLLPAVINTNYMLGVMNKTISYAICALGVYVVLGLTGQMSLAQAAFFAIGGYATGIFSVRFGLPYYVTIPVAVILSGFAGFVIGAPTLKLSGRYLTITTMGFTTIVELVLINWRSVTNGSDGLSGIPAPSILGWQLTTQTEKYFFALAILVIAVWFVRRLRDGEFGMALVMVRDNEEAAQSCGINIAFYKTVAFVIGGMLSGLGGAVYAHQMGFVQPTDFAVSLSQNILVMLVVGGFRYLPGALVGALVITLLPEFLRVFSTYRILINGLTVVLIVALIPGGLCEIIERLFRKRADRQAALKGGAAHAGGSENH